ncbi:MAG TPA: 5-oxoprolinase subunit PxpA [Actinomycetota bacterium]|nr:5-oxoprolinase subunit PxpA [Actinomycetota bacterium]
MDLNSDLGEGYGNWALGNDAALLGVVTSANVACGFHAGDPATIDRTVRTATERGVAIGAQVSYPDLVGFGRREIDEAPDDLTADVLYQIGALEAFARAAGSRVRYVKPHGALYNRIARDPVQAAAVVEAIRRYDPSLPLLTLPGSAAMRAAQEAGVPAVGEGFADRAYTGDGRLVSRREPGAVLHDPERVAARAVVMATEGRVETVDGGEVTVEVRSLCVHGDTPGAVDLAKAVRSALDDAGVTLEAFA